MLISLRGVFENNARDIFYFDLAIISGIFNYCFCLVGTVFCVLYSESECREQLGVQMRVRCSDSEGFHASTPVNVYL